MSRPEGHITILFTDMESSSSIAAAVGNDVYREKLREPHNRVIRQAIQEAGGYEVGTPAGDSFMAVFHRAEQALACAVAIQQVLESQPITARGADGQEYRVRVRVGVHTAENPLRLSEEQEYVGADVAFAKRVESLGVGGQILVSSSARRSCGEVGYSWRRWPNRRLRGFENTQTLFELLWDGTSRGEPGAAKADVRKRAQAFEDAGRWAEAERCWRESLEIMREYGDRSGECHTLNSIGAVCLRQGNWKEAEEALVAGRQIARELGDQRTEARLLANLGLACHRLGRPDEAERCYRQSAQLREAVKDRQGASRSLRLLGLVQQEQGRFREAEESLRASLEKAVEAADPRAQALAHRALGSLYQEAGRDLERAREHYHSALQILVGLEDRQLEAEVLSNLALLEQMSQQFERADRYHRSSVAITQDLRHPRLACRARLNQATGFLAAGRTDEARRLLKECYETMQALGDQVGVGTALANLALLLESGGDWETASSLALQAAETLQAAGETRLSSEVRRWVDRWMSSAGAM